MRAELHIVTHFVVPGLVGWVARLGWRPFALMLAANLVDLDHLLATPVYDANRCSLTTHPLHGAVAATIYVLLLVPGATRWLALGLLIHLGLDGIDCWLMARGG